MKLRIPRPKTVIIVVAGLLGMLFDQLERELQEEQGANDLTLISGIGPAYARRLNEAGIMTFAQLAELAPEKVRKLAHLGEWQGDPEGWIRQAKALS